ncbi:MAG: HNH endonuclease signature motif containing protein [Patescibacteria group bacterium]
MIIKNNIDIDSLRYNDLVELECEYCHHSFWRTQTKIKSVIICSTNGMRFCSTKCQHEARKTGKLHTCDNCGKEFYRPHSQANNPRNKSDRLFCSSSCAATYNNSHNPDRKFGPSKSKSCKYCSSIIGSKRKVCDACKEKNELRLKQKRVEESNSSSKLCKICGDKTFGRGNYCLKHISPHIDEYTLKNIKYEATFKSNRYTNLRSRARIIARDNNILNKCELCGYDKIVMCCHIKSISSFDENTKIKDINTTSNLIGLCPNCHWEFDHNLLSEDDKKKIENITEERKINDVERIGAGTPGRTENPRIILPL